MENGAKNKAILLSPWGTTGQCLSGCSQLPPRLLQDSPFTAGTHLGKHNFARPLFLFNQGGLQTCMYPPTHTHTHMRSSLTCCLIDLSVSGTNYGSGGEEKETGRWRRQSCPHPVKDFNLFMGQSDWPAPSSQMSEICLRAAP